MDVQTEKAMLAAILAGDMMPANVSVHDFELDRHRRIFQRMEDLQNRGEPIDRVTVANELMKNNELAECGGLTYIVELYDGPRRPLRWTRPGMRREDGND